MEPLIFSDDVVEVPVTIGKRQYVLREANAEGRRLYRNASAQVFRMTPDQKVVSVHDPADVELLLVSLCLHEVYTSKGKKGEEESKTRPVTVEQVRLMRGPTVRDLFERAKTISDLDQVGDTAEDLDKTIKLCEERKAKLVAAGTKSVSEADAKN